MFNDLVVYAKGKLSKGFTFLDMVPIALLLIQPVPPVFPLNCKEFQNGVVVPTTFYVTRVDKKKKKYLIVCKTNEERDTWFKAFQGQIELERTAKPGGSLSLS